MAPQGAGVKSSAGYIWVVAKLWRARASDLPSPLPAGMSSYEFSRGTIVRLKEISDVSGNVAIEIPRFILDWDDVVYLLEGAESSPPKGTSVKRGTIVCATRGAPLRPACEYPFPDWPHVHAVFNATNEIATVTFTGGVHEVSLWSISPAGSRLRVRCESSWNDRERNFPPSVVDDFASSLSLASVKADGNCDILYAASDRRFENRRW